MSSRFANLQKTFRRLPRSQRPQPLPGLRQRTLQKLIASLLLLTMTSMVTLQAQAAAAQALQQPVSVAPPIKAANLSDALKDLHESLHKTQRNASAQDKAQAGASGILTTLKNLASGTGPNALRHQGAQDLLTREASISKLEADTLKTFAATEAHLKAAHLPAAILQRHYAAVQQFQQRSTALHAKFASLRTADSKGDSTTVQNTLGDIDSTLSQWEPKARQVDPNHLPWGSPSNKVRAPYKDKNDYLQHLSLFGIKPIQVAYNGTGRPVPAGTVWPTLPTMGDTVVAADTQPTEDVQITPAIQALATQLGNNPVKIFQWVHDNIRYIPTYGSIQGSDYTLQLKAGNDADTASLLIALLRTSNIPARYVYGTVNVPADQLDNWVGGVNTPDAAQNLLGQGGVPNVAITQGGKTISVQMEHVWVEAFVNYVPSRGWSKQNPDTWVPLDASYKQYQYTAPTVNLQQAVPFDAQKLLADAQNGATVAPDGSYVQNLNQTAIQTDISNYQAQVQNYLSTNQPIATVGNAIGTLAAASYTAKVLPAVTPYALISTAADFDVLPDSMRHYFVVQIYQDSTEQQRVQQLGGTPAFYAKLSTPSLAGKELALSFNPASQADVSTINSYFPAQSSTGSTIPVSQFPTSLPGYTINMIPSLTVNGSSVVSVDNFMLGQQIDVYLGYQGPNDNIPPLALKNIRCGEYYAIGMDMQGISNSQLKNIQNELTSASSKLHSQDSAVVASVTKDDTTGEMLQSGVYGYYFANDAEDFIAQGGSGIVGGRYLSFGTFSTNYISSSTYGVPLTVQMSGFMMDIDRMSRIIADVNNDSVNVRIYVVSQAGRESQNEASVPADIFQDKNSSTTTISGTSATVALGAAVAQGQKIYTINSGNFQNIAPLLSQSASVISDIESAVNSGKVVTISQGNVVINGWTGAGYVVTDQVTGASAYLISGGANGAIYIAAGLLFMGVIAPMSAEVPTFAAGNLITGIGFIIAGIGVLLKDSDLCKKGAGLIIGGAALSFSTLTVQMIPTFYVVSQIIRAAYLAILAGNANLSFLVTILAPVLGAFSGGLSLLGRVPGLICPPIVGRWRWRNGYQMA